MNKASATRRPAPRTATPEELAEESAHAEAARAERPRPPWTGPKADPEVVAAAKAFYENNDLLLHLSAWDWAPSSAAEVLVALRELATFSYHSHADQIEDLMDRVDVLEKEALRSQLERNRLVDVALELTALAKALATSKQLLSLIERREEANG